MCKKILNILFPTNITGKRMQTIEFDISDIPTESPGIKTINVQWSGAVLRALYTRHTASTSGGSRDYKMRKTFYGGGTDTFTVPNKRSMGGVSDRVINNLIYFKCINVTSLVVNGQVLI